MPEKVERAGSLDKSLGLGRLSLYGIGTIIGAGIYSVIASAAEAAGSGVWLSFVLAGIISALSGLSYAELASALPGAGAEHNFLRKTFPAFPVLAFTVGMFIAVHGAATLATVGLTFGNYTQIFFAVEPTSVALGLMVAATALNISGVRKASTVSAALTILQVSGLLLFALCALIYGNRSIATVVSWPDDLGGVLAATAIVFFIYSGYEHMASLTEEAKNPDRDIWRSFMIAMAVTTVVYLSVLAGVLALIDVGQLAGSEFPLVEAAGQIAKWFGTVIAGAALLSTANAVLSASLSGSRLLFGMARAGDLPKPLSLTLGTSKSPWVGALILLALAGIFAWLGEIKFVASLSSLGVTLVFTAINVAVIVLRFTQPELERPFAVPSIGRLPVTPVLGAICSLLLAAQYDWSVYLTFAAAFAAGALPYALLRRTRPQESPETG